ncbi:MAG: cytochrome c4 [Gammaproteobacteria bacterium]|nr:cytochrome c4 [Gammaproteobacteria bacterium]
MKSKTILTLALPLSLAIGTALAQSPAQFMQSLVPQPPPSPFTMPIEEPWAAPSDFVFGWTPPVMRTLQVGDPVRGEAVVKEARCAKCHGDTGVSEDDDTPSLAGQTAAYTFKQLVDYKTERRENRSMRKAVRKLSPRDMADIGAFYAAQTPQEPAGGEPPHLVNNGDRSRLLLACNDCHNESKEFRSQMEIPATLAGQKPIYFVETMKEFRSGTRANDLFGRMRFIASRLTDDEITALARYYATPPAKEE